MKEIQVIRGEAFEYFCNDCGQFRLAFGDYIERKVCGNCDGNNLTIGKPNELDKEALKERWKNERIGKHDDGQSAGD